MASKNLGFLKTFKICLVKTFLKHFSPKITGHNLGFFYFLVKFYTDHLISYFNCDL